MSLEDWSDAATYAMVNYPNSWEFRGTDWQAWGAQVFFNDPFLSRYDPPNPYVYDNWVEWAKRLADSMAAAPDSPNNGVTGPVGPGITGANIIAQTGAVITTQSGNQLTTQF
jgi:hypothetical protein